MQSTVPCSQAPPSFPLLAVYKSKTLSTFVCLWGLGRTWDEAKLLCMHTTQPKYTRISFLLLVLRPSQEAKFLLIWEKVINLLLRQVRYRGNFSEVVPHLTSLATGMTRFGEDKVTEGILGAIGLGKKSCYSHQYVPFSQLYVFT